MCSIGRSPRAGRPDRICNDSGKYRRFCYDKCQLRNHGSAIILALMDFLAIGSPHLEVKVDGESRDQMEKQLQAIVTVLSLVNPLICGAMFAQIDAGQSRATQLADATRWH